MTSIVTTGRSDPPRRAGGIVPVLAFAGIVVSLMQTIVIPLVPMLPSLLGASSADTAWAITATLLAAAVATPTMGRLGDMFGKRRMLLISMVLLVAGSVVVALSSSLIPVIVGRTLQGLAAGVIPLGISIMRDELPPARLASATAMMSASLGVGGALGLPAAAFLAEQTNWHMLFWVAAGLAAVGAVLVFVRIPESSQRTGGRIDGVGVLGLSVALVALLLAVSKGADWGWGDPLTLGLLIGAVVVLLAWGRWELSRRRPLVDLRTFARRPVLFTNIASAVFGFAMFAMSLVLPQLLQLPESTGFGLGQSMLAVGLIMAPSGLVMMVMAPVSARISAARGPRVTLMVAAVVVTLGYVLAILLMSQIWHFVLVSMVVGAGIGLGYGAMPALIMGAVPRSETASANSLNTLMRSIGTSVSSAVAGVVLAQLVTDVGGVTLPTQNAFRVVLAVAAGAALVALVVAAAIPAGRRAVRPATGSPAALPATDPAPAEPDRTVTGRVSGGTALVTVTAHTPDGGVVGSTQVDADGRYRLDGLPVGPLTLVAVEHPAVHETVTVRAGGLQELDLTLGTAPSAEPAPIPVTSGKDLA